MHGITIVGPGRMGGALAIALSRAGYTIDSLVYRRKAAAAKVAGQLIPRPRLSFIQRITDLESPIVFISTQDEDIGEAVARLKPKVREGSAVFHTSGSLSSDVLSPLRDQGCVVASLHPLASVSAPVDGADRLAGAFFCVEGDKKAVRIARELIGAIGGHAFTIDASKKALYHAAALTAAGHVTAVFDVALSLMTKAGLARKDARRVLQPLLETVTANLRIKDTPKALTGTFARGDAGTLDRHLAALERSAGRDEVDIYMALAERSIGLARQNGLDPQKIAKMRRRIKMAKEQSR